MGLISRLLGVREESVAAELVAERALPAWYAEYFKFGSNWYAAQGNLAGNVERIGVDVPGYASGGYAGNSIVFACIATRMLLLSEARFAFRDLSSGHPGEVVVPTDGRSPGTSELEVLAHPWASGTTGDMIARMDLDVSIAGNAFVLRSERELRVLRPDWIQIRHGGDPWDPRTQVVGYVYHVGGPGSGREPINYPRARVAHYAPYPDPLSPWRGMSWMTPAIREIEADSTATTHKRAQFEHGGTPNLVVKTDPLVTKEIFDSAVTAYREGHEGAMNAGRAWWLSPGFDPQILGSNLQQLDFKSTQGAGETRIAAASGVHPVVVALSEGMQGSSLNAGNFNAARRLTADKCLRPLWRNICGSLEWITKVPRGKELWYDERDIAFLREDEKDAAEIQQIHATTIKQLVDSGFEPEAATEAVTAGDLSLLKGKHTGVPSVQLQAKAPSQEEPTTNGGGRVPAELREG